jgi:mono/diheme cytochrome c family protein
MAMKLTQILIVAGMVVGVFVATGLTQGSSPGDAGELIFKKNCMGCHPGGGNVIKPDKPVKGALQLKTFAAFLVWIRNPVAPMPAYSSTTISDDQAKKLYDYILKQEKEGWK